MNTGLLFVHAFPLDSSMWTEQAAAFPSAIIPDLPGFGSAPASGAVMTMLQAAERCVTAMDTVGCETAIVCGLSMGGYVAFEMWRSFGDRVAGLVFANTRAEADDDAAIEKRLALAQRLNDEGSGFLVDAPPPLLSGAAGTWEHERVRSMIAAQPAESIAAASIGMTHRPDSTPDLPAITVPVLVINSTGDALIPGDATARIAAGIPNASLVTIEGAGHLSNLEAPAHFNHALRDFLSRLGF
jgi:pimeloyl-ACP methyl ester carboxylesterase